MEALPSSPGVYWFLDQSGNVLYVGKAKDLKKRLHQYAYAQDDRPQIFALARETDSVKWDVQESELQALLVEAELIRNYQPHYNILLKDDKSDLYICLNKDEFPRIFTARKPEVMRSTEKLTTFGPYPSGYKVRQVLSIARRIFKWCDRPSLQSSTGSLLHGTDDALKTENRKLKPCFYYHIDLCDGACVGKCSVEEYQDKMKAVAKFLRGKTSQLIKELKAEIETDVDQRQFEHAATTRDMVEALIFVTSPKYRLAPDLVLPTLTTNMEQEAMVSLRSVLRSYLRIPAKSPLSRIEGYDISNISGTNASCSMVVAIDGKMDHSEYKHFGIKTLSTPNDFGMLREALVRRQNHPEWGIPDVILIDGGKGQLRSVLNVWKWQSIVISIAKRPDRLLIPLISFKKPTKKNGTHLTIHNLAGFDEATIREVHITYKEIPLTEDLPATRLIQTIRDESHRFAKRLHTIKRNKGMLE